MTWLDIGNGWRNLFLLSCGLQAAALGLWFCLRGWFSPRHRVACFLTGVAATPLCQYLWMLLLALVWPQAPRWVCIGVPPVLAAAGLAWMGLSRLTRLRAFLRGGAPAHAAAQRLRAFLRMDRATVAAACFAACVVILLAPVCVRYMSSMESVRGGDAGEYLALAQRYCEDRDLGNLLEKDDTTGHFRGHSHFPSLELYMSYGLFHTGGQVGYPNDKAVFTGLGLNTFYMAAAYLALLIVACRGRRRWVLLGVVLFNLVPDLFFSVESAPRDIWRILALLWAMLFFAGLEPQGSRRSYLGKLVLSFAVCFTVMSTHVVCFVVLPFIVAAWVIWRWLEARMTELKGAAGVLLRSVGLALSGAAGTLLAFSGNLWCYFKWGEMSPWRLMTTYTDAPWYDMYMDIEYKLEETTTHLHFFEAKDSILQSYATPVGEWGLRLALITLVCVIAYAMVSRVRMRRRAQLEQSDGPSAVLNHSEGAAVASTAGLWALYTLLTLAPMTGLLDSPLYSFSGSFLKLPRYTIQWFLLACGMICGALSALETLWPPLVDRMQGALSTRMKSLRQATASIRPALLKLPACLCVLLCLLGVVKGTNQTGYTNTFYRYSRDVMESERILLDNGFRERYGMLMAVAEHVKEDQKILITRVGYQYPLRGRGYVLTTNPIVPLMNLPLEEVGEELAKMNVAMLATEPDFWDERYYPLSTLADYLEALPADQIVETEDMRLYLLDRSLIPYALAAKD